MTIAEKCMKKHLPKTMFAALRFAVGMYLSYFAMLLGGQPLQMFLLELSVETFNESFEHR